MASLIEASALAEIVDVLYDLLPATYSPVTFGTVAAKVGVAEYWPAEKISKAPRIRALLEGVLTRRRERFCSLIEAIVAASLSYRQRKGEPVQRSEIARLNVGLSKLKFKIPELLNPAFLNSLAADKQTAPPEPATPSKSTAAATDRSDAQRTRQARLTELKQKFLQLAADSNRQAAGIALQHVLRDVFDIFDLQPQGPFRITGEEIDGSFYFEKESHLLEAKWTAAPTNASELYAFDGKIRHISQYTRGLFISINGYSEDALIAARTGDSIRFIMLDGGHLFRVLDGHLAMDELLMSAWRRFTVKGQAYVPVTEIY